MSMISLLFRLPRTLFCDLSNQTSEEQSCGILYNCTTSHQVNTTLTILNDIIVLYFSFARSVHMGNLWVTLVQKNPRCCHLARDRNLNIPISYYHGTLLFYYGTVTLKCEVYLLFINKMTFGVHLNSGWNNIQ